MQNRSALGGIKAVLLKGRREAQRRGQSPSTAHVLLVMLRSGDDAGAILAAHGVSETKWLGALRVVDPEGAGAMERALESAARVAREAGDRLPGALHLLMAVTRDVRSAAHKGLLGLGVTPHAIYQDARLRLGLPTPASPRRAHRPAPRPAAPQAPSPASRFGVVRGPVARRRPVDPRPKGRPATAAKTSSEGSTPGVPPVSPRRASPDGRRGVEEGCGGEKARRRGNDEAPRSPSDAGCSQGPFDLDPQLCPLLDALGRNLTAAAAAGAIDPVIGREREIDALLDVLARRRSNNPILVGPPGVGKTAIVEGLALALVEGGEGLRGLEGRLLVEISAGALVSGTGVRGALSERIARIREEVARTRGRIILFIDEIHTVVGGGEGPDDLAQELKSALARGELSCVGATTEAEYRKHFEKDPALVRRFSPIAIDEPSEDETERILAGLSSRYEAHHGISYDADALRAAVALSARYLPEQKLPDKAIGVLDLAAARIRRRGGERVGSRAVAEVIAERAKVPVERLLRSDAEQLLHLESLLAERVVGHEEAIRRIADALRKGAAGLRGGRPLGTFLLLGPTGVGKTETAKAVSDVFFPGSPMTRIDMSEFAEPHTVARLLGAPPGYVGHDEGGQLTEPVRRRPYQLLLLDEIEKAHPEVLLSLLSLLDEGRLTDGRGRTVDFTNTIVMMTSNLGAGAAAPKGRKIGFGESGPESASNARAVLASARASLPPELWNRIDEPLCFGKLGRTEVETIAKKLLGRVGAIVAKEHGIELEICDSAISVLIEAGGYDAELGARPMRRTIGRLVEGPLAEALLRGELPAGSRISVWGERGTVHLEEMGSAPPDEAAVAS